MKKTVVKEGPLVLIWRLILSELSFAVIFYILSFLENYEMFYRSTSLGTFLRYDIFLMIMFSLFQIFAILVLFVYWYFSYFEITQNEISKVKGILRRTKKSYLLEHLRSIEVHQSILEKKMIHASIAIQFDDGKKLHMRNLSRFEEARDALEIALHSKKHNRSIGEMLKLPEGQELEFKETLRFDVLKSTVNKDIEKAVIKTIAGFLNSKGGTLLIGVKDNGEVAGLFPDFGTLKKQNRDGFENYFGILLKEFFGGKVMGKVIIRFEEKDGLDVCVVNVLSASAPVFVKSEGKEEFFVRSGNSTHPLSMSEAESYIRQRFGHY